MAGLSPEYLAQLYEECTIGDFMEGLFENPGPSVGKSQLPEILKFTQSQEKDFKKLKTDIDCVNYAIQLIDSLPEFSKYESACCLKDDSVAKLAKESGNNLFAQGKFLEACVLYTNCISLAKSPEALAVGYGNRSAALFGLNFHLQCLQDIERALKSGYPSKLKPKLRARKKKALVASRNQITRPYYDAIPVIPENKKNSLIQCASNAVEMKRNKKLGLHIVATRDIEIGEVISVEKPFASEIYYNDDPTHCVECLELCYNPIPCKNCSGSLYCNDECRLNAWESYHQFECAVIDIRSLGDRVTAVALKITLVHRNEFDKIDTTPEIKVDSEFRSDCYQDVCNLPLKEVNCKEAMNYAVHAARMFKLIKMKTIFFKSFTDTYRAENQFKTLFLRNMMLSSRYTTATRDIRINSEDVTYFRETTDDKLVSFGLYPFLRLLNHSCNPNTESFSYGSRLVTRAMADIKKGQPCTQCYIVHYHMMSKVERHDLLRARYQFSCDCIACVGNWRVQKNLHNDQFYDWYTRARTGLLGNNNTDAKKLLSFALEKFRENPPKTPKQIARSYVFLCKTYDLFGNKISISL